MRTSSEVTIPLRIDRTSETRIRDQLRDQLRSAILGGVLRPGDPLPSSRTLAEHCSVARGTVVAVYDELAGEGIVGAVAGSGTVVTAEALDGDARRPARSRHEQQTAKLIDLRPGHPSNARLPHSDWNAAWRAALAGGVPSVYPSPRGERILREQIAEHLRTARGFDSDPDEIIVTAGTTEAIALIFTALAARTATDPSGTSPLVAIEDPGYPAVRRLAVRTGIRTIPIPVDADGLSVDRLRAATGPIAAAIVTPSHQYPLGGRLHINARLALLSWARVADALIVEDDYDSEFRYVGAPLPSIASLDTDGRVLHVGSFSKVLTPDLRCGYVVIPNPEVRAAVLAVRGDLDMPVAGIVQRAIAHYLANGSLRRHIARVRRDYAHKRGLVLRSLGDLAPDVRLDGLDGGLHAVIRFADSLPAASVVELLRAQGIAVAALSDYAVREPTAWNGLVIGYGSPTDLELTTALGRIRAALS